MSRKKVLWFLLNRDMDIYTTYISYFYDADSFLVIELWFGEIFFLRYCHNCGGHIKSGGVAVEVFFRVFVFFPFLLIVVFMQCV